MIKRRIAGPLGIKGNRTVSTARLSSVAFSLRSLRLHSVRFSVFLLHWLDVCHPLLTMLSQPSLGSKLRDAIQKSINASIENVCLRPLFRLVHNYKLLDVVKKDIYSNKRMLWQWKRVPPGLGRHLEYQ